MKEILIFCLFMENRIISDIVIIIEVYMALFCIISEMNFKFESFQTNTELKIGHQITSVSDFFNLNCVIIISKA